MKIVFVVNTLGLTGGIKVVLEYANRLQQRGHDVSVVHLLKLRQGFMGSSIGILKIIKYIVFKLFKIKLTDWFNLDSNIKIFKLYSLKKIKKCDVIIATANETADWVNKFSIANCKRFYFVQDYEIWTRKKSLVKKTYIYPLEVITTSTYLEQLLKTKFNIKNVHKTTIGIDSDLYNCAQEKKPSKTIKILMQYHFLEKKGIGIGIKAFSSVQKKKYNIKLVLFGQYKPREELPANSEFFYKPSQEKIKELYCNSDIFIFPSIVEGFGMPPMEAMACNCPVIMTDTGGARDYAIADKTAIIIPPGKSEYLAKALEDLLSNKDKREKIADSGNKYIKNFTWEKSIINFENILKKNV